MYTSEEDKRRKLMINAEDKDNTDKDEDKDNNLT